MKRYFRPQQSLLNSIRVAFRGLFYVIKSQRSMRIHLVVAVVVLGAGVVFNLEKWEWAWLLMSICLVLMAEALNTAVELSVDLVTRKHNIRAMYGKDVAAGAVLISVIHAVIVSYLLFWGKLATLFQGGYRIL